MSDKADLVYRELKRKRERMTPRERAKPLRRPPKWQYPEAARRRMHRRHREINTELWRMIQSEIYDHLGEWSQEMREDSLDSIRTDGVLGAVIAAVNRIRNSFDQHVDNGEFEGIAEDVASQVAAHSAQQEDRIFQAVLGIDVFREEPWLSDELASWSAQSASRMRRASSEMIDFISEITQQGLRQGRTASAIREDIVERYGISRRRAQFIARDQIATLSGELMRRRQKEAGIERFRWQTSEDQRVRDSHKELNQQIFEWDKPPHVGIPGEDYNCRCTGEPVFEDIIDRVDKDIEKEHASEEDAA